VVSDDGRYVPADGCIRGSLFRVEVAADGTGAAAAPPVPIPIGVPAALGFPGPAHPAEVPVDLEAIVPLPGAADLWLLSGERDPRDPRDEGANTVYVVRCPAGSPDRAEAEAFFLLADLPDDRVNDRLEAVVATAVAGRADAWMAFAFKERTAAPGRVPVYFGGLLERHDGAWTFTAGGAGGIGPAGQDPPVRGALVAERDRIGSPADACLAPDGSVWVLDRWRREVHVAQATLQGGLPTLSRTGGLDFFELVQDVPGEVRGQMPMELPAPGTDRRGFGRHEAMAFDARGRLYLAADLGGGQRSVLTVLAPKAP
jgi:hypothetical protein